MSVILSKTMFRLQISDHQLENRLKTRAFRNVQNNIRVKNFLSNNLRTHQASQLGPP